MACRIAPSDGTQALTPIASLVPPKLTVMVHVYFLGEGQTPRNPKGADAISTGQTTRSLLGWEEHPAVFGGPRSPGSAQSFWDGLHAAVSYLPGTAFHHPVVVHPDTPGERIDFGVVSRSAGIASNVYGAMPNAGPRGSRQKRNGDWSESGTRRAWSERLRHSPRQ